MSRILHQHPPHPAPPPAPLPCLQGHITRELSPTPPAHLDSNSEPPASFSQPGCSTISFRISGLRLVPIPRALRR